MKKFLNDSLVKLGALFLLNVCVIAVYLIISLLFKIPVIAELISRFADADAMNTVLYALYTILNFVFLGLLIFKNSSARRAYLNATADEKYSLKGEFSQYIMNFSPSDFIAALVFSVASFLILLTKNSFLRLVFLVPYSLENLFGGITGMIFYAIVTPIFMLAVTLTAQKIWTKNRLGGKG